MLKHGFVFLILIAVICSAQTPHNFFQDSLGTVQLRHAREIAASNWAIGGETLDRDYTNFDEWQEYLGPLGAKQVRLQGGWAKCEPRPGEYQFDWLDDIIDNARGQGVEPWLQLSYGNPIYPGGGDVYLGGGMPNSEVALRAWDRWVRQLAMRYKGRVNIWEIWNEPDLHGANSAEDYAGLYIRSAKIIRSHIPDARLFALSLAKLGDTDYAETFLRYLKARNKLHLVDEITVHGYRRRPEAIYPAYEAMRQMIARYSTDITLRQGELGCPSQEQPHFALSGYPWSETSQAKWLLRRLVGDWGHGIPSLYFTIVDIVYEDVHGKDVTTINTKGLLQTHPDRTVARRKPSYFAMQHLTAVFDHRYQPLPNFEYSAGKPGDRSLSVYAFGESQFARTAVALWLDDDIPGDENEKMRIDVAFPAAKWRQPVWFDLRTGEAFAIPADNFRINGSRCEITDLPVYDSPVVLMEKSALLPYLD